MILALSFVGKLPSYVVECIHQCRIYFSGDIYLILNDLTSIYLDSLKKYNVILVEYNSVESQVFNDVYNNRKYRFCIVPDLIGREELFIRSFERFFLIQNLMEQKKLNNCLFLELDNLIYDNPENWLQEFSKNELCYMYDNINRCSSGIMYIKNSNSLNNFLQVCVNYIINSNEFLNEMSALNIHLNNYNYEVEILPTYWNNPNIIPEFYKNYGKYGESIFDSAPLGIYLLGMDPHHTNGVIQKYQKWKGSYLDFTKEKTEWKEDDLGRKKPYVFDGEKWLLINNLHVHSKNLIEGLSLPL
jgi:hypothetical protein